MPFGNILWLTGASWDGKRGSVGPHGYEPFGEEIPRRGVGAQPFRFSTKCHDEETGLLHCGFYAHHWGRWLSKDPIGERGGVNLYGFVGNDPCNWVDVLGRERYQPGGPLKGVTWGEDEHFRPGEKDPFAKRPDHSSPRYNLKTKEKDCPCTANWKMIVWEEGSPNLDILFNAPNGSGWHEEAHAWGYLDAYRKGKTKISEYLNKCFGGQKLVSARFIVGNRQGWVPDFSRYLNIALHVGQHPQFGNRYEYQDSDPLKPTQGALNEAKAKVDTLDGQLRTYEQQFRSAP